MAITSASPTSVTTVEPGGIEAIPSSKRHGSPWQLLATWSAPNLEFATVFVGVIAVAFFGLGFWQAIAAIVIGNALGGATQGILSTWGPREGLAQLVLSRTGFGTRGNILPAAINSLVAGIGWFAVNSVSGAFALSLLVPALPTWASLVIIVVLEIALAFVGHDLVQFFERYASIVLGVIFLIAVISVFASAHTAVTGGGSHAFTFGGFTLTTAAAFGYAAGWNPYASDYSRYLPKASSPKKIFWAAGLGNFVSCTVLMAAGAAAATLAGYNPDNPTDSFVAASVMPFWVREITLVAIAVGAIAANALNVYSGAMSFLAVGIKIPLGLRRAIVALVFGVIGFFVALSALKDAGTSYTNFLLVIAYWIAPWLGVVFADRIRRRGTAITDFVPDKARYANWAGFISFIVATVVSIWLFSDQTFYSGVFVKATTPDTKYAISAIGDLTALVGFVLAFVLYFILAAAFKPKLGGPLATEPDLVVGIDAAEKVS
ncbi:MAG TPA: cytosine permease [Galbitalea sp.]|jgi:NCS1 family nucleobase:cation symporter-1|nr:cytosine permease [Galbitalea sp.]